jgi:hypothetical protein
MPTTRRQAAISQGKNKGHDPAKQRSGTTRGSRKTPSQKRKKEEDTAPVANEAGDGTKSDQPPGQRKRKFNKRLTNTMFTSLVRSRHFHVCTPSILIQVPSSGVTSFSSIGPAYKWKTFIQSTISGIFICCSFRVLLNLPLPQPVHKEIQISRTRKVTR